jgi:type IV secretory pathway TrbD component
VTLAAKPIPRVLSRRNLMMGCEREPVLVALLVFGGVGLISVSITAIIICSVLWVGSFAALRWMAKADPQMFAIYRRAQPYQGYYPAAPRPYEPSALFRKSQR